jgi:RNA polymerase sigma-70 factor (ECF subfamily)
MEDDRMTAADLEGLYESARAGDEASFAALVEPHRGAIQVHCYRMLGSFHQAEDATQETLIRAWRALPSYEARAPFLHWLYSIATNTCLMMIRAAGRRPRAVDDLSHLGPYPDRLLDALPNTSLDPAREVEHRESVTLAFITSLQLLPATQRAAVILKDVLAFSSADIATALNTTTAAVNSSLQRARARLKDAAPTATPHGLSESDRSVLARFVDAWQRRDIEGLTALLAEDAILRMPPEPVRFDGPVQIVEFLSTVPADGRLDLIPLVPTRANGQPALAAYGPHPAEDGATAYGVMVFHVAGQQISRITGFADPDLFDGFGLPHRYASLSRRHDDRGPDCPA